MQTVRVPSISLCFFWVGQRRNNMKRLLVAVFSIVVLCVSPFIPSVRASPPIGAVVQSWHYDPLKTVLILRVLNISHKDITAYDISMTVKYADGTTNFSEVRTDFLPLMATMQGGADDNMRRQFGNGTFEAGTSRDDTLGDQPKQVVDVTATLDVVAYADRTADMQNEPALDHLVGFR